MHVYVSTFLYDLYFLQQSDDHIQLNWWIALLLAEYRVNDQNVKFERKIQQDDWRRFHPEEIDHFMKLTEKKREIYLSEDFHESCSVFFTDLQEFFPPLFSID